MKKFEELRKVVKDTKEESRETLLKLFKKYKKDVETRNKKYFATAAKNEG